jgi:HAD superfamily hydrolase (TIGR01509 family)
MDGVLVDGEPLHFAAVNRLMGEEGLSITLEQYKPYMGTKSGWSDMIQDFGMSQPREHYSSRYRAMILESYREQSAPLPGAVELVRGLRAAGMPIAVASSSILPWVTACLERIGLAGAFDRIITGSDVENGKPAPDIYLLAAERIGADPRACLAIEDAPAGIESAHAAGMECWAIRTPYTEGLTLPNPARTFQSLVHVSVAAIAQVPV